MRRCTPCQIRCENEPMDTISLLFDREQALLGEVAVRGGACGNFILTVDGESQLGARMSEWQTRGVPLVRKIGTSSSEPPAFYQIRVQMRDPKFLDALTEWSMAHGFAVVELAQPALECWELLSRLPLEPRERFAMIVALSGTKTQELAEWRAALEHAATAVSEEADQTQAAINKLWEQTAKDLSKKFKTKTTA